MSQSQTSSPSPAADSNGQTLLTLKGFTKSFGAVQAMKDVSLDVYQGEVLGLVGDNGAGKSTLIKAISGAQPADTGEAQFDGKPVKLRTPHEANSLGIATVYQDLALAENLDVVANLFLGQEVSASVPGIHVLDEVAMEQKSVELLSSLGVTTLKSVRTEVAMLSGGQRQAVAIPSTVASCGVFMVTGWPSQRSSPESGGWAPETDLISVDLPAPLSPTRPTTSPR